MVETDEHILKSMKAIIQIFKHIKSDDQSNAKWYNEVPSNFNQIYATITERLDDIP